MKEYKGFRADRLREVMEKHEATLTDIIECRKKIVSEPFSRTNRYRLYDIAEGYKEPLTIELFAICEACNCTADYLLGLSDEI